MSLQYARRELYAMHVLVNHLQIAVLNQDSICFVLITLPFFERTLAIFVYRMSVLCQRRKGEGILAPAVIVPRPHFGSPHAGPVASIALSYLSLSMVLCLYPKVF